MFKCNGIVICVNVCVCVCVFQCITLMHKMYKCDNESENGWKIWWKELVEKKFKEIMGSRKVRN